MMLTPPFLIYLRMLNVEVMLFQTFEKSVSTISMKVFRLKYLRIRSLYWGKKLKFVKDMPMSSRWLMTYATSAFLVVFYNEPVDGETQHQPCYHE